MFIDDASNCTNLFLDWLHVPPQLEEVVEMTRHDSQTWERFLWTSGGLLNLTKCTFYIIASYVPKTSIPDLRLTSGNQPGSERVKQLNFDEAHQYLGNRLSTDMQMTSAYKALFDTASQFSARVLCSNLSRRDTWVAYFAVFVPSMTYTLPVSHHSQKRLTRLQSAATRATLMKHGGLGFRDLFLEQGIGQVEILVRHLHANSTLGILIRFTLAWWQLVVGVSYPLLEAPNMAIPHLAPNWLSSMRSFLTNMEASIHIDRLTQTLPTPLQENDACIMDVILSLPDVSRSHLRTFNRCRIFFGVAQVSEIGSANGTSFSRDAWEGWRIRMSPLLWPYQPCPGPTSFRVWRRLLATPFLKGNRRSVSARTIDLSLRRPLGRWLSTSTSFRCQWPSFYSASSDELFLASEMGATFTCHRARKIRRRPKNPVRVFSEDPSSEVTTLPFDVIPVDCSAEPHKIVIPVTVPSLVPPPEPPPYATTWIEYVDTLPGWEQELLSSVSFVDRRSLLLAMRPNDCILLASDGGAADRRASFRAVLATHDTILLECGGRAQGANPRSFRAEGYGILAILRLSFHVRTFYMTRNSNLCFKLYCDSESLIKRIAAS
jgi:hypothetical protein